MQKGTRINVYYAGPGDMFFVSFFTFAFKALLIFKTQGRTNVHAKYLQSCFARVAMGPKLQLGRSL